MDTQQISAPSRAPSRVRGDATPPSGVVHDNSRHTSRFTVVGNHLTQHRELSLTAIGLAAHIQSLPAGARIGIKDLAGRFPEGEARIAAALRELEAHGYLRRTRTRLTNGRIVTRTVSCNQPSNQRRTDALPARDCPQRTVRPPAPVRPCSEPGADDAHPARSRPRTHVKPAPRREPAPLLVPQPAFPAPSLLRTAADLLVGLHRQDPRLLLSAQDVDALAPGSPHGWSARSAPPPYSTP